jgi:hypothetical protein
MNCLIDLMSLTLTYLVIADITILFFNGRLPNSICSNNFILLAFLIVTDYLL